MKKNKKERPKSGLKTIYKPYQSGNETFSDAVQKYYADTNAVIEIDGKTYYHALQIMIIYGNGRSLVVALENKMHLKVGDVLIDDLKNQYTVSGFAMFRFSDGKLPDWYRNFSFVTLKGNYENVGKYFSLLKD